jgi:hypothetical protein
MRRSLPGVLLFLLALAIQALAPATARVIMARAQNDGTAVYTLCVSIADPQGQQPLRAQHDSSCLLCQIGCDGAAPLSARVVQAGAAPVQWTHADWTAADRAPPARTALSAHRARAPPAFS